MYIDKMLKDSRASQAAQTRWPTNSTNKKQDTLLDEIVADGETKQKNKKDRFSLY